VAFQKQNYFQRRTKPKGPRTNDRIRASEVQVIDSSGQNLGTLSLKEAIDIAKQEGLDLIEISPNAKPPVCKIIDIGKYRYDLQIVSVFTNINNFTNWRFSIWRDFY
tara:strand:+ start:22 stop:342 length:321 start_codon:yes stop_codon:yes gene_type:complete